MIILLFLITGIALLAASFLVLSGRRKRLLPPGPTGKRFSGVKYLLPRTEPWKTYAEWSAKYQSPIISFRVYNRTIIVLNDLASLRALLDQRAGIYSERPMSWMYNIICGRGQAVFNIPASDPRHRVYRRLLQTGLGKKATEDSWGMMQREAGVLVEGLADTPEQWTHHVRRNAAGVIMKLAFGYTVRDLDDTFIDVAEESAKISGWAMAPGRWMVDYYPWLRHVPSFLPGAQWKRQGLQWRKQLSHLSDVPYRWAKKQIEQGNEEESFITRLLRAKDDHADVKSTLKNMTADEEDAVRWCAGGLYAGAADTTVSALTSFVLLMALYPAVQRKAQMELSEIYNEEGSDPDAGVPHPSARLYRLQYLLAIMKEVLRYAPVANLALPHSLAEDDTYMGFLLPKGASVMPNIWAIMHDPVLYPDPYKFTPERFLSGQPDPRQFAFGFGRRVCPGMHFAETTLLLNMATILSRFDVQVERKDVPHDIEFTTGITRYVGSYLHATKKFIGLSSSHIKPFDVNFILR